MEFDYLPDIKGVEVGRTVTSVWRKPFTVRKTKDGGKYWEEGKATRSREYSAPPKETKKKPYQN